MKEEKLTIGQLAKLLNVSVRTLQYYDQIGLMKPDEVKENGRRIYSTKDIATLHQIISLKSLGFSLEDIKNNIIPVNNTESVVNILDTQSEILVKEIDKLKKGIKAIEVLKEEIKSKEEVDWFKYSNMVNLIQQNSEYYWVIKYLDNELIDYMSEQKEVAEAISPGWWKEIFEEAISLEKEGIKPESKEAQELAEKWWSQMEKISKGDLDILNKMIEFYYSADQWPEEFKTIQQMAQTFIEKAFLYYAKKIKL
ncbi:MerR family transcriptional regulator [uncultured Clostridium sp.]|uniref:MerR family transcriptional regulator n=1 Tax=uncultured Clostridium sp. TaxID=59620 RepID=UPI0026336513|nr:MerR family transcriptional regulator [uncultured Clostridium sp.]